MMFFKQKIYLIGFSVAAMLFWLIDPVIDFYFFNSSQQNLSTLTFSPSNLEIWIRTLVSVLLISLGVAFQFIHQSKLSLEKKLFIENILETAQEGIICITPNGIVTRFNHAAEQMFEYHRNEILDTPINNLMPPPFAENHDDYLAAYLSSKKSKIIGRPREVIGLKKDGTTFPLMLTVSEIKTAHHHEFTGHLRDLSNERKAQTEVKEQALRYEAIVEDQPQLICRYQPDFTLTFVNSAFCQILNKSKDELLSHSWISGFSNYKRQQFQSYLADLTPEHPTRIENNAFFLQEDGSKEWVNWTNKAIYDEQGQLFEYQDVGVIITAQKNAELRMEEEKIKAEQANLAKSEFLSQMSHELRTPMNAILGFAQLLDMDNLNKDQHDNVNEILSSGYHLLELINQVLDLSKIESEQFEIELEVIELNLLIKECIALILPLANRRQITIIDNITQTSEFEFTADRLRIKQIMLNLMSNAVKYNNTGGTLKLSYELSEDDCLKLNFIDSGYGINATQLTKLFQPFERLDAKNGNIEGTGIGLTISKKLIEEMKGTISVTSTVGQGSCFCIELPLSIFKVRVHIDEG
ncbi:MAG: PAS domain S-box protein [Methylococcaceae bacterium]|nr:PAS domain S-box protein [Methylococcaceae bacterium]